MKLGALADPIPAPQWADFAPRPPGGLGRMLGGSHRYQAACEAAECAFAGAQADHQEREAARQHRVATARARWDRAAAGVLCIGGAQEKPVTVQVATSAVL